MSGAFQAGLGHFVVLYAFEVRFSTSDPSNPPVREAVGLVSDVREIPWAAALPVWAPTLRWYKLGRLLHKFATSATLQAEHPEVVESLRDMGFPLGAAYHKLKLDMQIMAALQTFHRLHGHTNVPRDFRVPRGDPVWPVATWGFNLGTCVENMPYEAPKFDVDQLADLERVRFDLSPPDNGSGTAWDPNATKLKHGENERNRERQWSEYILPLLELFREMHGHCVVFDRFVVPSESPWPTNARGLKPGHCVVGTRDFGDYAPQIKRDADRLEAIGFRSQVTLNILPSLEVFRWLHSHLDAPLDFVVPSEAPWPENAWGHPLRRAIASVIKERADADRDEASSKEIAT